MAPRVRTWRGGGHNQTGRRTCRYFSQTGNCPYGTRCTFAHDLANNSNVDHRQRPEEAQEQRDAEANYSLWKRLIKSQPRANDIRTIEALWTGALEILNGDDRDWKQMLPRDLDSDENYGKQHIRALHSLKTHSNDSTTIVKFVVPFLQVMTHQSLLDYL